MRSRLLATFLLPLLWVQGRRVRKHTPRLPEAGGARQGTAGNGPALRLWVVGDSAAAGVGVARQADALSGQLAALIQQSFTLHWQCHATTGHSACDTARQLNRLPAEQVDVIVCSVGVNDAVALRSVRRWRQALDNIVRLAKKRYEAKLVVFSQIPPLQAFPALPSPLNHILGLHASTLNRALARFAAQHDNVLMLTPLSGPVAGMMASDGFHPGAAGYRQWAAVVADAICENQANGANLKTPRNEPTDVDATNK